MHWLLGLLIAAGILFLNYWPFPKRDAADPTAAAEREHMRRHRRFIDAGALFIFAAVLLALAVNSFSQRPTDYLEGSILLLIALVLAGILGCRLRRLR